VDRLLAFAFGLEVEQPQSPSLSIATDCMFIRKGMRYGDASSDDSINIDYLSLASFARLAWSVHGLKPYLLVGPEVGFSIGAERQQGERKWDIKREIADFDFSITVGAGFPLTRGSRAPFIEVRYAHGLVDIHVPESVGGPSWTWKTRAIYILMGKQL
jgi:hypothetical protein